MKSKTFKQISVITVFLLSFSIVAASVESAYVSIGLSGQVVPGSISPGESGNLVLTISNGGTAYARKFELDVNPHSYINFGQTSYELGTIAPGGSTQVSIPITVDEDIPESTTTVFFSISYTEGDATGSTDVETSTSISISKRSLIQIKNTTWGKGTIEPGDVVDVDIYMKNVGNSELRDTFVRFSNSSLPFVSASGDDEVYIGDVSPDETEIASFSIIVNKESRNIAYRVPVTIRYYDDSGTLHNDVKYIGLKISGEPEFIVALEDDSDMYAGEEGEITLSIANRGTATASFLTLDFDSGWEITPSEYYVGNLDPDDYETVTLKVDLSQVYAGSHAMDIEMSYKDPYNQEESEHISVDFKVQPVRPLEIPMSTILLVVAVVGLLIFWKRNYIIALIKGK